MHKAWRYTGYADSRRSRTIELSSSAREPLKPQKFLVWILLRLFYNSDSKAEMLSAANVLKNPKHMPLHLSSDGPWEFRSAASVRSSSSRGSFSCQSVAAVCF